MQRPSISRRAFALGIAMREKITGPGNEVGGGTPEDFATFMATELNRWSGLVKARNLPLE